MQTKQIYPEKFWYDLGYDVCLTKAFLMFVPAMFLIFKTATTLLAQRSYMTITMTKLMAASPINFILAGEVVTVIVYWIIWAIYLVLLAKFGSPLLRTGIFRLKLWNTNNQYKKEQIKELEQSAKFQDMKEYATKKGFTFEE